MLNKLRVLQFNSSTLLLALLIVVGYAGNYFSFPFGFGVDFLFGSIAVLVVVSLYGIVWGTVASSIAGFYTIILWQHPYASIIFTCETLFVAWRLRQGDRNIVLIDMIFWLLIGMPLVWLFYSQILQVGAITTSIILVKQPVNGIFNALVASLILTYKPLYRWAKSYSARANVFFEQILLDLLVAFVIVPALMLIVVNNRVVTDYEQEQLIETVETSAQHLASELQQWHQSGLEALRYLAETSSQTRIVVSEQTQESMELAIRSLPLFRQIYMINADLEIIATATNREEQVSLLLDRSEVNRINFSQLDIPRKPQIFVLPSQIEKNSAPLQPKILQTLPIILDERWVGNIIAELNIDFIEQLLQTETLSLPLRSTLLDKNNLVIASTDSELNFQQILNRRQNGEISYVKSEGAEKVYHWLPIMPGKALIARWKESFYGQDLLINEEIPLSLIIEVPASPYIDYLQSLYIRSLTILLLIALSAILIAKFLSRLLVKPIFKLTTFTNNLPNKLLQHKTIEFPRSFIIEMNTLATNFEVMSKTIEQNIQQIQTTNRKLQQAKETAEIASKAKDLFLANISHELKTPLNSILGYSKLIQKKLTAEGIHTQYQGLSPENSLQVRKPFPFSQDGEKISSLNYNANNKDNSEGTKFDDWLEIIQQNGKDLLNLIDEILDYAKAKAYKARLSPSLITVLDFMEDIVRVTSIKAAEKNIFFLYETSDNLPTNVYADDRRLRQILLNLLNNAIKFTNKGQVTLKVSQIGRKSSRDGLPPQVNLRFAVIDTGIGISQPDLDKIFQPFEQIERLEAKEVGTGLGLAICKMLVELMGGKLNVQSELNKGSVFWFDLAFPEIQINLTTESLSVREIVGYKGKRFTILVVDDVPASRLLFRDILEPLGFKVATTENGQQALQFARQNQPDLILTDLFMPIRTGFTLVPEIRRIEGLEEIPIITVSASGFEEVEKQSRAIGCDAFLTKPIDDEKLLNLIEKYLNLEWVYRTRNS